MLIASFSGVMGVQMVSPLLPAMRRSLGISTTGIGWVIGAFSIAALVGTLPAGMLADRYGPRAVLIPSLILFGGAGIATPLFRSFDAVIALRVLQGFGYAAVIPLTITILIGEIARERIAKVQSYRVATMSTAEFSLPLIAGALLAATGRWQFVYLLYLLPLGIALIPRATSMIPTAAPGVRAIDGEWLSRLLGAVHDGPIVSIFAVGFVRWWLKYSFFTYGPLYMVASLHLRPDIVGAAIAAQGLLSAAVASQSGRLGLGRRGRVALVVSVVGMGVAIAGFTRGSGVVWVFALSAVLGMFDGVVGALSNGLVAVLPPREVRSTVVSVSGTTRNLGKAVAPPIAGAMIAVLGYRTGFLLVGVVGALAPAYLLPLLRRSEAERALASELTTRS